jgi:hypothetical protein
MDVAAKVDEARHLIETGHEHKAGSRLEDAVYATSDVALLTQIRDLALEVQARKGHELKYGNWHDILSEANIRLAQAAKEQEKAPA